VLPHREMLPCGTSNATAVDQGSSSDFRFAQAGSSVWVSGQAHPGRTGLTGSAFLWPCSRRPLRFRSTSRVKRSRALLASNPTRDRPADGAPRASPEDPRPRWWTGVCFFVAHWTPELCLENASSAVHRPAPHQGWPARSLAGQNKACRLQSLALAPTTIGVSAVACPSGHP
jgi:hypothetical protein